MYIYMDVEPKPSNTCAHRSVHMISYIWTLTTAENRRARVPQEPDGDLGGDDLPLLDVLVDHLGQGRLAADKRVRGGVCMYVYCIVVIDTYTHMSK